MMLFFQIELREFPVLSITRTMPIKSILCSALHPQFGAKCIQFMRDPHEKGFKNENLGVHI